VRVAALLGSSALLALAGCRAKTSPPVQLVAGPTSAERVEFVPRSAFAEYYELDGLRSELRIVLTSYPSSCDNFAVPRESEISVAVTVVSPAGIAPEPGTYVWSGHEAHGGTPARPERAFAVPTARIGPRAFPLPEGGSVELRSVARELEGRVSGYMAFEFAGDAERAATSLRGGFDAKLCRFSVP
jgi:hypothetical protein